MSNARSSGGKPTLQFTPGGEHKGFSAADVALNRDSYAAVRELVQNSLDAAGDYQAKIRFVVETVEKAKIPAIAEYEQVFKSACEWMKKAEILSGQNRNFANVIKRELQREKIPMLFVIDNGVGLAPKSMRSLLGSGATTKDAKNAGSYGVGHLAAFCLSRLNYLLYGGLHKGKKICAGHAQLASHHDSRDQARGKDGYFVVEMRSNLFNPFDFAEGENVPELLSAKLDEIQREFKHGSVVALTAFNFLNDERKMPELIQSIVAENFFPAIDSERLTVDIINGDGAQFTVGKKNLAGVIHRGQGKARASARNFPSGQRVAESYDTLKNGKTLEMPFEGEKVLIRVRENAQYRTNIVICRKGMWITDDFGLICANRHYGEKVQFDALLLSELSAPKIHEVIRSAEGPLHNEMNPKEYMDGEPDKAAMLRKFSAAVQEFLNANIKEIDSNPWDVEGFLSVDSGKSIGESLRNAYVGEGVVVPGLGTDRMLDGNGEKPLSDEKPGIPFPVQMASYWEPGAKSVQLVVQTDKVRKDAELRLHIDGGADESCTSMAVENLFLRKAQMDGKNLELLKKGGKAVGALLGELPANQQVHIHFEFEGENAPEKLAIFCDFRQRPLQGSAENSEGMS